MRKKRSTFRGLRRRSRTPRFALALAAAGTAAGAAGAVVVRRRRTSGSAEQAGHGPNGRATAPSSQHAGKITQSPANQSDGTNHGEGGSTWTCQCGQEFRVSGRDRHRLYWLPDAKPEDPVLDDRCPSCERQLSAEQAG